MTIGKPYAIACLFLVVFTHPLNLYLLFFGIPEKHLFAPEIVPTNHNKTKTEEGSASGSPEGGEKTDTGESQDAEWMDGWMDEGWMRDG